MPTNTEGLEAVVPEAAGRRLSNQVARAYRGTYGARVGLRTIVRAMSVQMLRRGVPSEAVARALADFAVRCPVGVALAATRDDAVDAIALPSLIAQYSSEVAFEMDRQRSRLGAPGRANAPTHSIR